MAADRRLTAKWTNECGASIIVIAVAMVFVLGMAGLGVDLASLYVARSQAQRAADAAALAGAYTFQSLPCETGVGGSISGACQALAAERAQAVGNQNMIAGVSPKIGTLTTDVTFPSTSTSDPQIRVVAARDTAHGNAMPTFFVKIFGIATANISATATAEAYNASGQNTPVGSTCMKPWLLPDCDPNTVSSAPNPYCLDSKGNINAGSYFTGTGIDSSAIGQLISIKPGAPNSASAPSEFYPVFIPSGTVASNSSCPSCASGQTSSGSQSGDLYRQNIECCIQLPIVCTTYQVTAINGNMVGPTNQGVECLTHQTNNGTGQDTYDPTTGVITAGWNNPYNLTGPITTSDSIVTLPIYDGSILCPGGSTTSSGSCTQAANVTVEGFMQLFIQNVGPPNSTVSAYVMNIVHCGSGTGGSGGGGGGNPIVAGASSPIPVRLIQ